MSNPDFALVPQEPFSDSTNQLLTDLDRISAQIDGLLAEREHLHRERQEMLNILRAFYESSLTRDQVQTLLDFIVRVIPGLGPKVLLPARVEDKFDRLAQIVRDSTKEGR